jgi:nicotinate-nucleotide adenylyltransferase
MIGIFGGTFDPVHNGHLRTALEVKEIFALDEVRLIPCAQPAHRELPLTSPEMRLEMLELDASGNAGTCCAKPALPGDRQTRAG